jgi:Arc/MetJ-type ribon-helix-helix transcriptional regulator
MSKQIAVRLPDEVVEFIDRLVQRGAAPRRDAVVARALERERRRLIAERDAAILAGAGEDFELGALAEYAVAVPMDELD